MPPVWCLGFTAGSQIKAPGEFFAFRGFVFGEGLGMPSRRFVSSWFLEPGNSKFRLGGLGTPELVCFGTTALPSSILIPDLTISCCHPVRGCPSLAVQIGDRINCSNIYTPPNAPRIPHVGNFVAVEHFATFTIYHDGFPSGGGGWTRPEHRRPSEMQKIMAEDPELFKQTFADYLQRLEKGAAAALPQVVPHTIPFVVVKGEGEPTACNGVRGPPVRNLPVPPISAVSDAVAAWQAHASPMLVFFLLVPFIYVCSSENACLMCVFIKQCLSIQPPAPPW